MHEFMCTTVMPTANRGQKASEPWSWSGRHGYELETKPRSSAKVSISSYFCGHVLLESTKLCSPSTLVSF
ncbi:hypothetical protein ACRRTK_024551 [Alexandromys fortis]